MEKFINCMNSTLLVFEINRWNIDSSVPFYKKDLEDFLRVEENLFLNSLQNTKIIHNSVVCLDCGKILDRIFNNTDRHPYFRCGSTTCSRIKFPLFKHTIFDKTKLPLSTVLDILYNFSRKRTVADSSETLNISKNTIISFYSLFRASLTCFLDKFSSKLGGDGIVIHFDETPITHRHGRTGRSSPSNTVWVVGAIDIYNRQCFLKFLPSRSRSDLFHFLSNWILPGSVVHTDGHRSYLTLSSLGFTHMTVNHSRNLVAPDGTHTNWIEGIFGCLKKLRRKYDAQWTDVEGLEKYLSEFCFRYSYSAWDRKTAFLKILKAFSEVTEKLTGEDIMNYFN